MVFICPFILSRIQLFHNKQAMIFRNILGTVMNRLADLSPVKNLIKYILDRTLNQFLSDQIKIEDFKDVQNGKMLLLTNISLNTDKINRGPLLSSPYILHTGTLGKLKITLPNWSELASKSIELTAQELVLDLKPNKMFAQNFKESMKEEQENIIIQQMQEPGQISENSPLDFFRQLVKQMLLNMVIKFENVVIRLFINEPSPHQTAKPQYYLMFRVPLLTLGKAEDAPPSQENVQVVRFDSLLPQLSVHLLREGVQFPQYANQKAKASDFPFHYPSLSHPGTLLVMGKSDLNKEQAAKLRLTLTTNYKTQKKQLNIEGKIGSLETIIDPIQLKILSRFIIQLQQFQKVFQSVMVQLGLVSLDVLGISRQQSIDFTMSRTGSKEKSHKSSALVLLASVVMGINEPGKSSQNPIDLYSNIAAKPELKMSADQFNQSVNKQLQHSGEYLPEEGYKNITFKQQLRLSFNLGQLQLNLLKYVSPKAYKRGWSIDRKGQQANTSLGSSHFRGEMRQLNYSFSTVDNKHDIKMRYVTIHDVKIPNHLIAHSQISSEQFFQIDSSTYYNQNVNQDYFTNQPQLISFKLDSKQHICMEELLRISDGSYPTINTPALKRYAFMPEHKGNNQQGLSITFNSHKKVLKIEVKEVAVMANFQIWKDLLNITYPIFLYKQLVSRTTLSGQTIKYHQEYQEQLRISPFESAYIFTGEIIEEVERRQQPIGIVVEIGLVYCLYRETSHLFPDQNLISQVQTKVFDYDNFDKGCFCNLTERSLYTQISSFVFEKERQNFNLELKSVKTGFISLKNSTTSKDIQAFLIAQNPRVEEYKTSSNIIRTRAYLPQLHFNIELQQLITFIDMVKRVIGTIQNLLNFRKNLSSKIICIDMQNGTISKPLKDKAKKQKILQIFAEQIRLRTILFNTCIKSLFFKKEGHNQEIKINSLGLGLIKNVQTCLGNFRNNLMLTTYPHIQTFPGIDDTSLIVELGRASKTVSRASFKIQSKNGRMVKKLQFFDLVNKSQFSLSVFLLQKTQTCKQISQQKQFFFTKYRKNINRSSNSIIDEQKQIKNIQILLCCPIHLYLGNAAFLFRQKKVIQEIVERVSAVLIEIKNNSKEFMMAERKGSVESISEDDAEMSIKLKGGEFMVDLRPQFSYNQHKNQRVLSNTRMIVKLNLNKLFLTLCPASNHISFDCFANLEMHFLHHQDRDLQTNPIHIPFEQLKQLGFRCIAKLEQLQIKGGYSGKNQDGTIESLIDSINISLCISSIPALELFCEHFLKHNIEGDFGIEDQYYEVLNQQIEEIEVINEEQIEQIEKMLELKKQGQKEFESAQFIILKDLFVKAIYLKKLIVNRININLYGGNQFDFVQCNSLYQSKASVRTRQQDPDLFKYHSISLLIQKFALQAGIGIQTKAMLEFERIGIDYNFKRFEGLMWKDEKTYSMPILRIDRPLRVLLHLGEDYFRVKLNHLEVVAGFTDQIFKLTDLFSIQNANIQKSGWKRSYLLQKKQSKNRLILIIAPDSQHSTYSKVTISVQLKSNSILTDRVLQIKQLILHEPQSNSARMNQIIKQWVSDILTNNLGTLVTGAFSEVICRCIELLFGAIQHSIAFFIPKVRG